MDPKDHADARFTAYLALAKLEDADGLEALADHAARNVPHRPAPDAWLLIGSFVAADPSVVSARISDEMSLGRTQDAVTDWRG